MTRSLPRLPAPSSLSIEAAAAVLLWLNRTKQQKHKFVRMKLLSPVLPRGFLLCRLFGNHALCLCLRDMNAASFVVSTASLTAAVQIFQQLTYSEILRMGLFSTGVPCCTSPISRSLRSMTLLSCSG